ncbi:S-layer homology domain-containing protein, partial [Patescibacteria group bacterium]|nr:S-layer homology domain-containing protein [Patescibacteria group bacterium]
MKNFLLGLTVGILLVPLSTSAVAQLLSDVETGSWYEPAVVRMQELGILQGYSDGTFKPKKAVTRAELAVVMDRAIQTSCAEAKVSQDSPFNCDNVTQQSDPAAKRDAQRRSDVNTILSSIYQWAIDHQGAIPTGITSVSTEICVNSQSSCVGKVRLDELVGTYVVR